MGFQGATGATGPQGVTGPSGGAQGATGFQGTTGHRVLPLHKYPRSMITSISNNMTYYSRICHITHMDIVSHPVIPIPIRAV